MKILVTGAKGFVGKNLVQALKYLEHQVYEYDVDTGCSMLETYTKDCEFIYHLAGVNRPESEDEFMEGNKVFTDTLLDLLKKNNNKSPIVLSSSVQAQYDNPYGRSKKAAEDEFFEYSKKTGTKVYVYRLTNLFGKWSRPNYNTVVATFCYNISRGLDIKVNDPDYVLNLCYIDDVIDEFIGLLKGNKQKEQYYSINKSYQISVCRLAQVIQSFSETRETLAIPDMSDELTKKLYATYQSFLPEDQFMYELTEHEDHRGSFTEFIKSESAGQVSVNISKPGTTKGNHWHMTKNEKFLVVSGEAIIAFRRVGEDKIIECKVSESKLQVVDIPPGYTHNIKNTGNKDMVTIMWVNEPFDPEKPDTYYLEV